ncbi:MAG: hypothetical protein AAFZ63_13700 [Bacteroidota bacterium]
MTRSRSTYFLGLTLSFVMLFALACDEETAEPRQDKGFDYFPIAIGQEWNYEMDSIVLRPQVGGVLYDSVLLDVRETIVDTVRDLQEQLWFRGERYDRRADSTEWRFRQTFLLRTDDGRALRREDNLEFVKMVFPLRDDQNWDGHASFNQYREIEVGGQPIQIFADWNYRYRQTEGSATFENLVFDDIALVEGADYENLLNRRLSLEAYARGVGLVYRELEVFETQCQVCCSGDTGTCLDLPWTEKAEGGFIIKQRLVQ